MHESTAPTTKETEAPTLDSGEREGRVRLYADLTKARLSALVVMSAAVGYLLGLPRGVNWIEVVTRSIGRVFAGEFATAWSYVQFGLGTINWQELVVLIAGVSLAAMGVNALNQWMETPRDAAMHRTSQRPLPAQTIGRNEAFAAGSLMFLLGCGLVFFLTNPLAGSLTLLTGMLYLLCYTPLKPRTPMNTLVGALVGALPPMVGWSAAAEGLHLGAWVLGGILFAWQLPHFLALAWMYRDDYSRGGFRMLPDADPTGQRTARAILLSCLLLIPLGLMLTLARVAGWTYAGTSFILGCGFVAATLLMLKHPSRESARKVFFASIIYLPLLLTVMVVDQMRLPVAAQVVARDLQRARDQMSKDSNTESQTTVTRPVENGTDE